LAAGVSTNDARFSSTLTDDELADIAHWASQERLDGLAWLALAGPDTAWALTDDQRAVLLDCHLGGLRATVAAEATAVWAIGVLDSAAVSSWLLKGLASGHLDYPDPALRTSFDADVLVARRDLGRALDALLAAGCRRSAPALRGWWERRYARAIELISPDGTEIDLHAAVADGAFGITFDHDALRHHSEDIIVGGRRCRVLSPPGRLLATSASLVLTRGPTLRLARDIAQMVDGGVDLEAARRLAGSWAHVIDDALDQSSALIGGSTVGDPARTPSGWTADAVGARRALPWWERPRYTLGVVWPSRANLASRGHTRSSHLRQLVGRSTAVRGSSNPS
jgi:hypothetical protein